MKQQDNVLNFKCKKRKFFLKTAEIRHIIIFYNSITFIVAPYILETFSTLWTGDANLRF